MNQWIVNLISTVQLTRLANAFAGVANLWFVVLWCKANLENENVSDRFRDMDLWILLALTAVIGIGLSVYAGSLNDLFDMRRDEALSPQRPIASGRITAPAAAAIGFSSLILSIICAIIIGTLPAVICLICAALILGFNGVTRHIPAIGFISIAAIHGVHMLTINFGMRFVWPIMLIMIHATVIHMVVHRLEEKRPRITPWTIFGTSFGLLLLLVALVAQAGFSGISWEGVYSWFGLAWPFAAVVVFTITAINKVRFASSRSFAAEKLQRYGSLWMGIYGLAWLLGGGLYTESIFLGSLVLVGVLWMLFFRDLGAWIEQPIGYRW